MSDNNPSTAPLSYNPSKLVSDLPKDIAISKIARRILPPDTELDKETLDFMRACYRDFLCYVAGEALSTAHLDNRPNNVVSGPDVVYALENLGMDSYSSITQQYLSKIKLSRELEAASRVTQPQQQLDPVLYHQMMSRSILGNSIGLPTHTEKVKPAHHNPNTNPATKAIQKPAATSSAGSKNQTTSNPFLMPSSAPKPAPTMPMGSLPQHLMVSGVGGISSRSTAADSKKPSSQGSHNS
jgi:hypothetical protein